VTEASDVLIDLLLAWGVDAIFGLPRDGINGVFEALTRCEFSGAQCKGSRLGSAASRQLPPFTSAS
jgi:thiamine pyrophosphate-dependent acetolactate synthase large subunit-like protein